MTRHEVTEKVGKLLAAFELTAERDGVATGAELPGTIKAACAKLVATFIDDTAARQRAPKRKA